jgi:hypothetical protein
LADVIVRGRIRRHSALAHHGPAWASRPDIDAF